VDVISSVSGGSVAAANFALAGRNGFETLERDFIRRDGIDALLWAGLSPPPSSTSPPPRTCTAWR
jgi:hypothetical protein